jgi:hypothetical protein
VGVTIVVVECFLFLAPEVAFVSDLRVLIFGREGAGLEAYFWICVCLEAPRDGNEYGDKDRSASLAALEDEIAPALDLGDASFDLYRFELPLLS